MNRVIVPRSIWKVALCAEVDGQIARAYLARSH